MKINLEEILTKANARQERLKEFADYASQAEKHADNLSNAMLFFNSLSVRAEALDQESKELVPSWAACYYIGQELGSTLRKLTQAENKYNLVDLVKVLK